MDIFLKKRRIFLFVILFQIILIAILGIGLFVQKSSSRSNLIKTAVIDNKLLISFDTSDKISSQLIQLGKSLGIDNSSWIGGIEVGLDGTSAANLKDSEYKNYTFSVEKKSFKFQSVEKANYKEQSNLWDWGKFLPENSSLYYSGSKNSNWIQTIPEWSNDQNNWLSKVFAQFGDRVAVGAVREENVLVPIIIGESSNTEEVKKDFDKLKDISFDKEGGVLGYSETQYQGVKLYLTFIDTAVYKTYVILTFSPNVLEKEIRIMQGGEKNLDSNNYFSQAKTTFSKNASSVIFVQKADQFLDLSDEGIFKSSFKTKDVGNIFKKLSYLAVVQSDGNISGDIEF